MRSILLIPVPGSPLLAPGLCGARPPVIHQCGCDTWGHEGCAFLAPLPRALVLAWEGQPCPEGVFRAWDRWGPDEDPEFAQTTDWSTYDVLGEALDSLRGCEWLARACERCGLGRVVVIEEVSGG